MPENLFLINYGDRAGQSVRPCFQIHGMTYALGAAYPSLEDLMNNVLAADLNRTLLAATNVPLPTGSDVVLAPVENQEIWAAGVTYKRSEEARERESHNSNIYSRVYSAPRPELFFKGHGREVVGTGRSVGIRYDATWSVPEPELVVVINRRLEVVGFTIGNDMSSRDIEGENPLYLPQAKVYESSCAIGPRIWLQPGCATWPELTIQMSISRNDQPVFEGETSTASLHRALPDLVDHLGRCKRFPHGVFLFTGAGIIPPDSFRLAAGDKIRIRIDPIGELVNTVVVVGPWQPGK